jgi:hypothetical protein
MRTSGSVRRALRRSSGAVAAVVIVAVAAAPALAQATSASPSPSPAASSPQVAGPRDLVVLSGTVIVRRGDEVGEIVVFHGAADVAGIAHGDVVVLDGRIVVTGQVSGTVVSVDGLVTLGPNAHVLGDVIARDRIRMAQGAIVEGDVRQGSAFLLQTPLDVFGPWAAWLAIAVSTLILAAIVVLVAPRAAERVAEVAAARPWPSLGIGVALVIGVPLVAVLASITLVALPFGLALLLAVWFLASLGVAFAVFALGRRLWRAPRSRWLALAFGWLAVSAVSAIPYVGGVVWALSATVGSGAAVLAMRGARPSEPDDGFRTATTGRHRAGRRERVPAQMRIEEGSDG